MKNLHIKDKLADVFGGKKRNKAWDALMAAIVSVVLCVIMLVGATFCWYTASIETPTQVIQAGNIDVGFSYCTANSAEFYDATSAGVTLFGNSLLYPGDVVYTIVRVADNGDLGFGFEIKPFLESTVTGTASDGVTINLSDYVKVAIVELENSWSTEASAFETVKSSVIEAGKLESAKTLNCYYKNNYSGDFIKGELTVKGTACYYAIGLYLPETFGYNFSDAAAKPQVNVRFQLSASQLITTASVSTQSAASAPLLTTASAAASTAAPLPWDGETREVVTAIPSISGEGETAITTYTYNVSTAAQLKFVIDTLTDASATLAGGKYIINVTSDIDFCSRTFELRNVANGASVSVEGNATIYNLSAGTTDGSITAATAKLFLPGENITYADGIKFIGTTVTAAIPVTVTATVTNPAVTATTGQDASESVTAVPESTGTFY